MRHVQANADAAGTGAVIFDVETTELIERDVPLQRMEASVACAVRVPDGGGRAEEGSTFWHERALRARRENRNLSCRRRQQMRLSGSGG